MFLSKIQIKGFRGIKDLSVDFNSKVNVIIGENGCCKSALIDAIRILYNFGSPRKDLYIETKDFFVDKTTQTRGGNIEITYEFSDLSIEQKGAFYEFMVMADSSENDYAKVVLKFEFREGKYPLSDYYTGLVEGQKADYKAFELFQHYYLDALRDSTKDLLTSKRNILGDLVLRIITKNSSRDDIDKIIAKANSELLLKTEVIQARGHVNKNLEQIYKTDIANAIGLRIDNPKAENFINTLKPYLPHDLANLEGEGFELTHNSLGFNNLIYIATILGDISNRILEDKNTHFALLVEEPEAHLHPQLQLNLFNFIKQNIKENTQIFITSHSPTLTSKIPLENLILLKGTAIKLDSCFKERTGENIVENTTKGDLLDEDGFKNRQKQLERYIDVTRSQLFFAKGVLFAEGISEELLVPVFCKIKGMSLEDLRIEFVNVHGTSFYPFVYLFNSTEPTKRLQKKIAILTDDDRFTDSKNKEFSFDKLIEDDYAKLDELYSEIIGGVPCTRITNLHSVKNNIDELEIFDSYKTFEFEIAFGNIAKKKSLVESNFFVKYIQNEYGDDFTAVKNYYDKLGEDFTDEERKKIAILFWKTIKGKASFAQDFSIALLNEFENKYNVLNFNIPQYIENSIAHLTT